MSSMAFSPAGSATRSVTPSSPPARRGGWPGPHGSTGPAYSTAARSATASTAPPAPTASTAPVPGALRLTRRGRLVVFLAFLVAALGLLVFALSGAATGSGERGQPVPVRTVQVESGDTLWSIATRAAPHEDPRDLIADIEELNSLEGSLRVGQRIAVPVD